MAKTKEIDNIPNLRFLLRNFVIELVLYGTLVVGYILIALRYLNDFLTDLFQNNLIVYAFLALFLIGELPGIDRGFIQQKEVAPDFAGIHTTSLIALLSP